MTVLEREFDFYHKRSDPRELWVVYQIMIEPDMHPLFIGCSELASVTELDDANMNSEWLKFSTANPHAIATIRIVAICSTELEARNEKMRRIHATVPTPRCNAFGHMMKRSSRRILCSDGRIFANQTEAARMLKTSQGSISLHLTGKLKTIKGLTLTYHMVPETPATTHQTAPTIAPPEIDYNSPEMVAQREAFEAKLRAMNGE